MSIYTKYLCRGCKRTTLIYSSLKQTNIWLFIAIYGQRFLSISLHALQQYFLNGGTRQFLFRSSMLNSSQYWVLSEGGQMMVRREGGMHRWRRQRRLRSRGRGPQKTSSEAGQTSGRQDIPRPQVVEHCK